MHALARKEIVRIDRALAGHHSDGTAVHEARKAIRRLRSLLGLCEARLDGVDGVDGRLRSLGRSLSALRDAQVSVDTARHLAHRHGADVWQPASDRLEARRHTRVEAALAKDPGFARRRARLEKIGAELDRWDWTGVSDASVHRALRASEKRVARAEKRAHNDPAADNLHRWRRRARRLRMQLEVAAHASVGVATGAGRSSTRHRAKAMHRLTDRLGQRQDVEVLLGLLKPMANLEGKRLLMDQLRDEIQRLQGAQREA